MLDYFQKNVFSSLSRFTLSFQCSIKLKKCTNLKAVEVVLCLQITNIVAENQFCVVSLGFVTSSLAFFFF